MGNGCSSSSGSNSTKEALLHRENEINRLNPTEAYATWREKLLGAITSDPMAVTRDLPRMLVYVETGRHHNYLRSPACASDARQQVAENPFTRNTSTPPATTITAGSPTHLSDEAEEDEDPFVQRKKRLLETVLLLTELCGERESFGTRFEKAWIQREQQDAALDGVLTMPLKSLDPTQQSSDAEPKATKRSSRPVGSTDTHQLFFYACVESGMLLEVDSERTMTTPNVTNSPRGPPAKPPLNPSFSSKRRRVSNYGATDFFVDSKHPRVGSNGGGGNAANGRAPGSTTTSVHRRSAGYHIRSLTYHLMQFMVQGVMFFPVQRLKHILWTPWSSYWRDIAWCIHVRAVEAEAQPHESPDAPRRRIFVVEHVQTAQHYVEEKNRKKVPCFELDWSCQIHIDTQKWAEEVERHSSHASSARARQSHRGDSRGSGDSLGGAGASRDAPTGIATPLEGAQQSMKGSPNTPSALQAMGGGSAWEDAGISPSQLAALVASEVPSISLAVVAARVEKPPRTLCFPSSAWLKREKEFENILRQQYNVSLDEVTELSKR